MPGGPRSVYEVGGYQAARGSITRLPPGYRRDGTKRGVVYVHGAGELSYSIDNLLGGKQAEGALLSQIAQQYPLLSFDGGIIGNGALLDSDSWGNVNAQAEMTAAIARFQTAAGGGAKVGKVHLLGISMGHALSLTWAQVNAASVQSIVGILPVNDLDSIRDGNLGGFRASISTAWGAAPWTAPGTPALPAAANPALPANLTNVQAIPQRLYFASDDAICLPATVTSLVANCPICTTVNLGAGGHSDASVGHVAVSDVLAFLAAAG